MPNVREKFDEWATKGYNIYITTARKETQRELTVYQLGYYRLPYKQLIMDVGHGARAVVNDLKPYIEGESQSAFAFNVKRDGGLGGIDF
ncbi:MAG: hypothetical protein ACHQ1D_01560 [Nitrososphaerales archaeon]